MITTEMAAQRRVTKAFIDAAPVKLILTPYAASKTAIGGTTFAPGNPRLIQTFKLIEPGDSGGHEPLVTADGVERKDQYVLLGEWDSVMAVHDRFTYLGGNFEIVEMMTENGWERRGVAIRRA